MKQHQKAMVEMRSERDLIYIHGNGSSLPSPEYKTGQYLPMALATAGGLTWIECVPELVPTAVHGQRLAPSQGCATSPPSGVRLADLTGSWNNGQAPLLPCTSTRGSKCSQIGPCKHISSPEHSSIICERSRVEPSISRQVPPLYCCL